jgi:hypothetical protein
MRGWPNAKGRETRLLRARDRPRGQKALAGMAEIALGQFPQAKMEGRLCVIYSHA